ncbi:MAG: FliM/FliN family flagellar motor switch protein [Pseudomonadota bacterium]
MTAFSPALARFGNVTVRLSVELGRTDLPLRDVLSLTHGSVVPLNRMTDELLDITANGKVIARGEVVAQDGRFALRIVSLVDDDDVPPPSAPAPPPMQRAAPAPASMSEPVSAAASSPTVDQDTPAPTPEPEPEPEPVEAAASPAEESLEDILNDLPGGTSPEAGGEAEQ